MKHILIAALLMGVATAASAQTPQPADWVTLTFTADLNKNADVAWERAAGNEWCGIQKFLDVTCQVVSGTGELGSLRNIGLAGAAAPVVENIVSRSKYSYTYAQPFTPSFYHGTMSVEPLTATTSRLVYTLIWNQTAVGDAAAQTASREGRQRRFQEAVNKMAAAVNAP